MEMLVEKGAKRVVSFDIAPKPSDAMKHPAIDYQQVSFAYTSTILILVRSILDQLAKQQTAAVVRR